jgi:membrane dipeptidase
MVTRTVKMDTPHGDVPLDRLLVWEGSVGWTVECLPFTAGVLDRYRKAGFGVLSLTVAAEWNTPDQALRHLGRVRRSLTGRPDVAIVTTVAVLEAARAAGRLAINFNFQGGGPYGQDPGLVEPFKALGVGLAILSYNSRTALGDGCQEPGNAGLSNLGRRFVTEMNRVGVIIDLSHAGERTALDTIQHSTDPVVFSHSNPRSRHAHVRNIGKKLIKACAETGGVIGINSLSFMLGDSGRSTVEDFVAHVEAVADLVGAEHVALGMDWNFYDPFMQKMFAENPALAELGYPPPPWDSLSPETLPAIVAALRHRGWSAADIAAILGGNMMRIARRVWG